MTNFPSYTIHLDPLNFIKEYNAFRHATSSDYIYNEKTYRAVDKTSEEYAYLTFVIPEGDTLTLIVNLEFYYVYGFQIEGQLFVYEGEAYTGLTDAGFDIPKENTLPFGDAYYQIADENQRLTVANQQVAIEDIFTSIERVVNLSLPWNDKREDLLCVFWSLVEGIRFTGISKTVYDLLCGHTQRVTYNYFYYMAERWAELSIGAAYSGKIDKSIAVYELHRLDIPKVKVD